MDELFSTRCIMVMVWCHRIRLKSEGYEQVTVLLAVIIVYSNKC